jgi:hypothetical protein
MYDLSGEWDVRIQFLSGEAQHSLRFEQDGEALSGTYRSQYDTEPLRGNVRGNVVQLGTNVRFDGQSVEYRFEGTINGAEIQGNLDLGEYWQASWTAQKRQ